MTLNVKIINFQDKTIEACVGEDDFLHNDLSEYTFDEVDIFQYTGYKDDAGKEVYEDDVVASGDEELEFVVEKNREAFIGRAMGMEVEVPLSDLYKADGFVICKEEDD